MSSIDVSPPAPSPTADPADRIDAAQLAVLEEGGITIGETFTIALASLAANKLRTLLTALGIIIGVAAVVALMAIGRGSQESITAAITANGANLLTVRSGAGSSGSIRGQVGSSQTLTINDAQALADPQQVPSAAYVSPEYNGSAQIVAGSLNVNAQVIGSTEAYPAVHNMTIAGGEFISAADNSSVANVIVLGANIATTLFPDGDALGQAVRVNGQRFRVVGVLDAKGGSGFGSSDDATFVPLSTAQRKLFGGRAIQGGAVLVSSIAIQATDAERVATALSEIELTLREQHGLPADGSADDFSVINQQDILASVTRTTQTLTLFLAAIAAISLLVGGIGIMNIMLVSVRERTREIGLRKALGARESDILLQFMFEALTISLIGALIGLLIGLAIAALVSLSGLITAVPSVDAALLAIGFAMAVGLFFGIAPAQSAARLDPIDALRYE
ncbi:MAG TPA: ABC transporter permease [Roseiflexaceae bacterium]|nr:ABC transporter permease [Roseiflexaceae bacterium]HMP41328.1 ABC transporter permease [Roseiflexaceae bacterium]